MYTQRQIFLGQSMYVANGSSARVQCPVRQRPPGNHNHTYEYLKKKKTRSSAKIALVGRTKRTPWLPPIQSGHPRQAKTVRRNHEEGSNLMFVPEQAGARSSRKHHQAQEEEIVAAGSPRSFDISLPSTHPALLDGREKTSITKARRSARTHRTLL